MNDDSTITSSNGQKEKPHNGNFLLVGIGASAGGIKALKEFFAAMPESPGMAFVVILHLSQQHKSNLAEIIQRETSLKVEQLHESVKVEPDHVYVIPPGKHLEMVDGTIRLTEPERIRGVRVPIDRFLRTLAETYQKRAVGIILSGTGTDGTLGMKHIKGYSGFAIVQDPQDSEFDGMPVSAIATKLIDVVLPAAEMPAKLIHVRDSTERLRLASAEPAAVAEGIKNIEMLRDVLSLLRVRTGHDFTNYKKPTLIRRIARHLQIHETDDLAVYLEILRDNANEVHSLLKNLLINVTNFFRDKEAFEALETKVIPALFEGKTAEDRVRVWIAGCASGEEAYSLAMLLTEHAEKLSDPPAIQIFASDVDEEAVAEAREGRFTESIVSDVSPDRLQRYFIKEDRIYRVRKQLREMILFAPHNILRDPPFSHLDLVTCRNVLIYLNRDTQTTVLKIFNFALRGGGYLFLGSAESAESMTDLFTAVDAKHKIYQCAHSETRWRPPPELPIAGTWTARAPEAAAEPSRRDLTPFGEVHHRLIEEYAPPSVLVNESGDILHLSEHAGRYLRVAGGVATLNIFRTVNPALLPDLRAAFFTAREAGKPVEGKVRSVKIGGEERTVKLTVRPIDMPEAAALIIFQEVEAEPEQNIVTQPMMASDQATETVIKRLEEEQRRTENQLRLTIEQYETTLEEAKAGNEELQAMNEELRSASEELETGKEELQSVNEELTTVNHELKSKIEETSRVNADLQNLMAATDIATIFLDRELRIKRYTPPATEIFNLIPADVGRPLEHITHRLAPDDFQGEAARVLQTLKTTERETVSKASHVFLVRFAPYRSMEDKIEGVVLTFIDITKRKLDEQALAEDLRGTKILQTLAMGFVNEENIQRAYDEIMEAAINLTKADAGTVQWYDPESNRLVLIAASGFRRKMTEHFRQVDAGPNTAFGIALQKGERTFIDFDSPQTVDADGSYELHLEAGLHSAQSTPLVSRYGKPIGMVTTHWKEPKHRPTTTELRFLDLLSRQAADLIEQRQAEAALRESEERLRLVMESVEDYAIVTTDPAGSITGWNAGAEKIFGWSAAEAIGQPADIIYTPEDRQKGIPEKEMQTARDKGKAEDERWHFGKDGTQLFLSGVLMQLNDGRLKGFVKIARDMTTRLEAEKAVRDKEWLEKLVQTQEDERQRIARDLHDELGQQLTALQLELNSVGKLCPEDTELGRRIENLQGVAKEIDDGVDFLAWELRPAALDHFGLTTALTNYIQEWSVFSSVPAGFVSAGVKGNRFDNETEINLYRIVQEALNNVHKHAEAKRVEVVLKKQNGEIVLIVEDDGRGFDTGAKFDPTGGLGLIGMRERASLIGGSLEIESSEGKGTSIFARVPARPRNKQPEE